MNDYIIEYKKRGDEFSAHERHYVYSSDTGTAIKAFRQFFAIEEYEITEVAKVLKKDFSKM